MNLRSAYDNFIMSRVLKDLSPKTIQNYKDILRPFLNSVGENCEVEGLSQQDIEDYIIFVLGRSVSRPTKATHIRHLKTFLKWCSENYKVLFEPRKIIVPKVYKKVRKIYDSMEIKMIYDAVTAESDWMVLRNKSLISLMLDSGLRLSELLTVRYSRLSFSERVMTICGKGDKERVVPLGSTSIKLLKQYKKLCPFGGDVVFLGRYGEPMTYNAVRLLMQKISCRLPFEFSAHKLRHNFATNYCIDQYEEHGHVDIYKLMYLLGHEDIETTRIYLHFANSVIAGKQNISHLDRLGIRL